MGCSKCEDCCRNCCYSTPLLTLSLLCLTGLGLIGFALSGIYGIVKMDDLPHIENGTSFVAPVVCGAVAITIIPVVLVTFMSYCITGYIRDIIFHSVVKSIIGSSCFNVILLIVLMGFILLWVLIAVGMGGVMSYYVQVDRFCSQMELDTGMGLDATPMCLYYVDAGLNFFPICDVPQLKIICSSDGLAAGLAFSISLIFVVVVIMGLVCLALVHVHNHVSARDHIDCRETSRNNEYDLKRVH